MSLLWGAIVIILTLLWLGQVVVAVAPRAAARCGLIEPESASDPVFLADARGEAIGDSFLLWTLPLAGVLLLLQHPWWRPFALIGGSMWLYGAVRTIIVRTVLRRRGVRVGTAANVTVAYVAAALWGLIALVMIVMAV